MDAATVGALCTGLVTLVSTIGGLMLNRRRLETEHVARDVGALDAEIRDLNTRLDAALAHIWQLRGVMTAHEMPLPQLPDELARRRHTA